MSETVVLNVTETWHKAYPGAHVGTLTMHNVLSEGPCPALDTRRAELEASLRSRFEGKGREAIRALLYGPDQRTMLRPETQHVLFTVYAPVGIEVAAVEAHLAALRDCVSLVAPNAQVGALNVYA